MCGKRNLTPLRCAVDKWCEHIDWRECNFKKMGWYIHGGGIGFTATKETKFCPVCGAKRPEPREEELWVVLRDTVDAEYKKHYVDVRKVFKAEANAALDWFIDLVEKQESISGWPVAISRIDLLKELRGLKNE